LSGGDSPPVKPFARGPQSSSCGCANLQLSRRYKAHLSEINDMMNARETNEAEMVGRV
jgi:hypothetical protein